ncbi:MAG: hypothetical protein ABIP81_05740 [Terriglobales bacterium]
MKTEMIQTLTTTFEAHAQQTESGIEYWLARDLQHLLGYDEWRNFNTAVSKAKTACEVSGHGVADHFVGVNKMVDLGSGSDDNFALIRSKGDQALFGKSTQAMKAHWKVPDNRPLADFAPTIILKAKDFATEITIFNALEHGMKSESAISTEHITNNQAVRNTLLERGIRPESRPAVEDVKKVERRLASEEKKSLRNPDALESEK